jgi:hypothetical protein
MPANPVRMEIAQPRLFAGPRVVAATAYGLILVVPVLIAVLIMSRFEIGMFLSVMIPLVTVVITVLFLPAGLGNPHITRLVRTINPEAHVGPDDFVVQLTVAPRLRTGIRALLEDADDIGHLRFNKSELVFQGDSIELTMPYEQIQDVRRQNIGLRGLYVYGPRIEVIANGVPDVEYFEFAERSSWLLPTSRRLTERLFGRLSQECRDQPSQNQKDSRS